MWVISILPPPCCVWFLGGTGRCLGPAFSNVCLIFELRTGKKASFWKKKWSLSSVMQVAAGRNVVKPSQKSFECLIWVFCL